MKKKKISSLHYWICVCDRQRGSQKEKATEEDSDGRTDTKPAIKTGETCRKSIIHQERQLGRQAGRWTVCSEPFREREKERELNGESLSRAV